LIFLRHFLTAKEPNAVTETLQCLKRHGQRLDLEIAKEMRVPLATVRAHLTALADRREAIVCKTIQFENGRQVEAWQGRISGFVPPAAPGRKPKSK
jgi:predicted ArsR family transcriptional regulator